MSRDPTNPNISLVVSPAILPGDVEAFKPKKQIEAEAKLRLTRARRESMADVLRGYADRLETGELNGFALTAIEAATGKPIAEWKGICRASDLGHGISILSSRFFRVHST